MTEDLESAVRDKSVLVVEDDALITMMLNTILRDAGAAHVASASSVSAVVAALEAEFFDIAIFDRRICDGLSDNAAVLALSKGTAVVIASGSSSTDLPNSLKTVPVVTKPFDSAELFRTIATAQLLAARAIDL